MAVAFDAKSDSGQISGDMNFVHTPVGTPRAVALLIPQRSNFTNQLVSNPTYGGVEIPVLTPTPHRIDDGVIDAGIYIAFRGNSIPTGPQNVAIDWDATASLKICCCVTMTANGDVEVENTAVMDSASTANPSLLLPIGSVNAFVLACLFSDHDAFASLTVGGDYTRITVSDPDFGTQVCDFMRRTSNFTGPGDCTVNWTALAEQAGIFAVALKEIVAAAPDDFWIP